MPTLNATYERDITIWCNLAWKNEKPAQPALAPDGWPRGAFGAPRRARG